MRARRFDTCALCPRLCRSVCPVATGSHREAAVPAQIAGVLREWEAGRMPAEVAAEAATLCVDCGACQAECHLDLPLPAAIRDARARLIHPGGVEPLSPPERVTSTWVAVEVDSRPLAGALSKELRVEVGRWPTSDRLGAPWLDHPQAFAERASELRTLAHGLELVTADGGVMQVLHHAEVAARWLHHVVPDLHCPVGSCVTGGERPAACCGGAGPLQRHHPREAADVARWFGRGLDGSTRDSRCRAHLQAAGVPVQDSVDLLLARVGMEQSP